MKHPVIKMQSSRSMTPPLYKVMLSCDERIARLSPANKKPPKGATNATKIVITNRWSCSWLATN